MELHEIRYFLALSKTLNFTKAAEICNVTQPALTRASQKLEDELGGLLFSRERNNTHLTELGRLLEPHLTEVLTSTHTAKETATRFLRLDSAQLRLGVMCTIGPMRFVGFLSRFRADNPGVEITMSEAPASVSCSRRASWMWRWWRGQMAFHCRCSRSRSIANASSSPARPAIPSRERTRWR